MGGHRKATKAFIGGMPAPKTRGTSSYRALETHASGSSASSWALFFFTVTSTKLSPYEVPHARDGFLCRGVNLTSVCICGSQGDNLGCQSSGVIHFEPSQVSKTLGSTRLCFPVLGLQACRTTPCFYLSSKDSIQVRMHELQHVNTQATAQPR